MRAVRCVQGTVVVMDVPEPRGPGVLVRVASVGICATDHHLVANGIASTLGHEFGGWLADGTPVAVEPLVPCRLCDPCQAGDYQLCREAASSAYGFGRDGGMADACLVPASCIVLLPTRVEPHDACLVEPLAVAVHAVRLGELAPKARVAVVGAGPIGLCVVAVVTSAGGHVDLAARYDHQRAGGQALGARECLDEGYDVVFDAAGTSESLAQAVAVAKPGGRVVLVAGNWAGLTIPRAVPVFAKEVSLQPSFGYGRSGPARDVEVAGQLLGSRPEIADVLVTHRYPLEAAPAAFAAAASPGSSGAIKVVLEPDAR